MFKTLRQKVAKGLSPLPGPNCLDSGETALGGILPSAVGSFPVLAPLAMPSIIGSGVVDGFSLPRGQLAISVDLIKPQVIGKGLTDELRLLSIARPEITAPLDVGSVLQHPQLVAPLGGPDFGELPEIFGSFAELSHPQLLGRIYGNGRINSSVTQSPNGLSTREHRDRARCRHGLRSCGICNSSSAPRTPTTQTGRSRVQDVFGRLRFILQPPVLERLNVPDAFPDGRRPYPFQIEGVPLAS